MTKARLEEVIIVESNRGLGMSDKDPVRTVVSIFRKDGTLLAEIDSFKDQSMAREIFELGKATSLSELIPFPEQ